MNGQWLETIRRVIRWNPGGSLVGKLDELREDFERMPTHIFVELVLKPKLIWFRHIDSNRVITVEAYGAGEF